MSLVEKLFGSFSDRELKKVNPITKQVLALEPKYQAMSDADLQAQTAMFKQQLAEGKTLDDILPDAFAVSNAASHSSSSSSGHGRYWLRRIMENVSQSSWQAARPPMF